MSKKEKPSIDDENFELEQDLGMSLDEFDVEFPSETEIMMTIDTLRPYVPKKEGKWETLVANVLTILKHSLREVFYISRLFWGLNLLILLLGVSSALMFREDPYLTMLYVAPLPTIIGLMELFKSSNTEMAELEMSFKYSFQEVLLSRIVIVGAFNIVVNLLLTLSFAVLLPEVMIGKLLLYWVTPFTVIAAIMLVVATKFRQGYTLTGGFVLWTVVALMLSQEEMIVRIETVSSFVYILVIVAAVIFMIVKMGKIHKRGILYEFND